MHLGSGLCALGLVLGVGALGSGLSVLGFLLWSLGSRACDKFLIWDIAFVCLGVGWDGPYPTPSHPMGGVGLGGVW